MEALPLLPPHERHRGQVVSHRRDDLGVAETTDPPLTTMRNPIGEMAERATRLLLDRIDGRETGGPHRLIIPTSLVRRATA